MGARSDDPHGDGTGFDPPVRDTERYPHAKAEWDAKRRAVAFLAYIDTAFGADPDAPDQADPTPGTATATPGSDGQ